MRKYLKSTYLILIVLVVQHRLSAQDSHLSMYYASPVLLNPSLTGVLEKGDVRASAQYRSQWNTLSTKLATSTVSFDMPYKTTKFGVGGYIVNYDAAKVYNSFNMGISASYDIASQHQKDHKILMGVQLGLINKTSNNRDLVFNNQYQSGTFDPDLPSGETEAKGTILMPDVNYGLSYMYVNREKRLNPHIGATIFHLTNPRESFAGTMNSRLPLRYVVNGGTRINIDGKGFIDPKFLYMRQRNAQEFNIGMDGGYIIQDGVLSVLTGCYYRYKDAIIPMIGIDYKNITFRTSFDINVSGLSKFSRGRGGFEFSLVFTGMKVLNSNNTTPAVVKPVK